MLQFEWKKSTVAKKFSENNNKKEHIYNENTQKKKKANKRQQRELNGRREREWIKGDKFGRRAYL